MADALEPDLEEEKDELREELIFVNKILKKFECNFADLIRPLLSDTAAPTPASNSRLR